MANPLLSALINKLSGTTVVNNATDPLSAAYKAKQSIKSVPQQQAQQTAANRMMRPYKVTK